LKNIGSKYIYIKKTFLDKIEKLVPEELIGKKELIQRRYKNIYGNENIESKVEIYRTNNLKRLLLLLGGLLIVMVGLLISEMGENNYILTNEHGEVMGIKAPPNQQIFVPMEIGVFVEGKEIKEPINFKTPREKAQERAENNEEDPRETQISQEEQYKKIQREARLYIKSIGESHPQDIYYLPLESEEGEKIVWHLRESKDQLLLLLLFPLICVFVYRGRYRELAQEEIRSKKMVQIELSEFITKLILLLDAGLVMSAAFQKIVRDYEWSVKEEGLPGNYFYQQLSQINHTLQEAKGSFTQELKEFAHRSRVPEFIRVANIITDNYQMGSELVEKLRMEGEMLWFTRKKIAVEQGKLAEIKLSLPLMLLILSLLVITISPVLLEM
jgi:hypothetical protein